MWSCWAVGCGTNAHILSGATHCALCRLCGSLVFVESEDVSRVARGKLRSGSYVCVIEGCERPLYARGWCRKHFDRWCQAGDPLAPDRRASYDPFTDEFWKHVDSLAGPEACWPWIHSTNSHGYGTVGRGGTQYMAHRVAYQLSHGDIPKGMYVLHRCDNRPCCNPIHLFLGTHADNMADMKTKGRARGGNRPGEANSRAKLTAAQVREIRQRLSTEPQMALAREFGVSQTTISRILSGKRW